MKKTAIALFLLTSLPCLAQTDNTYYAKQFAGTTVGAKVTAAQNACSPNTSVQCVIVIDPSLGAWATGNMPTKCANCTWADYRSSTPYGAGSNYTLPPATSSILGGVMPDGSTINNTLGAISCANATTSQAGCAKLGVAGGTMVFGQTFGHPINWDNSTGTTPYASSQLIGTFTASNAGTIPAGGSATYNGIVLTAYCNLSTAATASTTFTFYDNGSSFGTVVFAISGTTGTFTISSAKSVASGDKITLKGPATADTTAAGIACVLPEGW